MSSLLSLHDISPQQRAEQKHQTPCVVWFTGLSGAGKSTLANDLDQKLYACGHHSYILDGDILRHGLSSNLGFSLEDRVENIRRVAEVAKMMCDAGLFVLVCLISPFEKERQQAKAIIGKDRFIDVFVSTPLEICQKRDPKGLYKQVEAGAIKNFTGIDSPYERPQNPAITLDTTLISRQDCTDKLLTLLNITSP